MTPSLSYLFAHQRLRALAFDDAKVLLVALGSDSSIMWLASVWRGVESDAPPSSTRPPDGLRSWVSRVGPSHLLGVVELPPPWTAGEAHFVGVMATLPTDDGPLLHVRYYTLVRGVRPSDGETCTVLGEWTETGVHTSFGEGPLPEKQAFMDAVVARYFV